MEDTDKIIRNKRLQMYKKIKQSYHMAKVLLWPRTKKNLYCLHTVIQIQKNDLIK